MYVCSGCGTILQDTKNALIESKPAYGEGTMLIVCDDCRRNVKKNHHINANVMTKLLGV